MVDNFRFFIPVDIQKSQKDGEAEVLKIKGIASTKHEDMQGESLDPNGFDLTYFLKSGHFNWNHLAKDNPLAVIGEPTKAEVINNELHVEGFLYPNNELAKGAYQLAQILSKNSSTRKLGLSIEGQATERDSLNPKIIKKAKITGCALTPSPVNPNTIVDVFKGIDNGLNWKYETIEENGKNYILSIVDNDSLQKALIDTNFEINIEKALSAGSTTGTETFNSEDKSGASLKKESVDGNVKKTKSSDKEEEEILEISKANIFTFICSQYPEIQISKANQIYSRLINLFDFMQKGSVSADELKKALSVLGIDDDSIVKSMNAKKNIEDSEDEDEDEENGDNEENEEEEDDEEEVSKSLVQLMKKDNMSKAAIRQELIKGGFDSKLIEKAISSEMGNDNDEEEDDIENDDEVKKAKMKAMIKKGLSKGLDYFDLHENLISKGFESDLTKSILSDMGIGRDNTNSTNSSEEITKGFTELKELFIQSNTLNEQKSEAHTTLYKSLTNEVSSVAQRLDQMEQKFSSMLEEIGAQPVGRPKSIITKGYAERFDGDNIQKSNAQNVLSISQHKQEILRLIDLKTDTNAIEKSNDASSMQWLRAGAYLESTNEIEPAIKSLIEREFNVQIVK